MNRRLFLDHLRLLRRNGALALVDAANCYDRMCHSIVSLSCQYFGVPAPPLICMSLAIQMMQFYLQTSYGDSDGHYDGNADNSFQGCCQGNGGAPAAWVAVSTLLVMYLKAQGCEAKFITAISCVLFSFAALMSVDNTDLPVIGSSSRTTPAQVGAKMQRSASVWAGGLRVTGGALKPEKCCWYLIAFEWHMGQWQYARKATHPFDIKVLNADGVLEIIKCLETDESKEAVGIIQNAEGDEEDMLSEMEEKSSTWIRNIRNGHLPRHLAWQACKGTIMRSIAYPFPATTISTKQAFTAMQKFCRETIPTLGTKWRRPPNIFWSALRGTCMKRTRTLSPRLPPG